MTDKIYKPKFESKFAHIESKLGTFDKKIYDDTKLRSFDHKSEYKPEYKMKFEPKMKFEQTVDTFESKIKTVNVVTNKTPSIEPEPSKFISKLKWVEEINKEETSEFKVNEVVKAKIAEPIIEKVIKTHKVIVRPTKKNFNRLYDKPTDKIIKIPSISPIKTRPIIINPIVDFSKLEPIKTNMNEILRIWNAYDIPSHLFDDLIYFYENKEINGILEFIDKMPWTKAEVNNELQKYINYIEKDPLNHLYNFKYELLKKRQNEFYIYK